MAELPEYLGTIDSYVEEGYWTPEEYDEAVHQYLHKQFGELFKRNVERAIYLDHDHHAMLEAEELERLCVELDAGFITERELEDQFLDWLRLHREV